MLQRAGAADEVTDLAIDRVAGAAVTEHPSQQILFVQRGEHKADGRVVALNRRLIAFGSRPGRASGLKPVPIETISTRSAPDCQRASGFSAQ
jgi:hypothetical protein